MLSNGFNQPIQVTWPYSDTETVDMSVSYLWETEELEFLVNMPVDSYIAIGFGSGMFQVDMIGWLAEGQGRCVDYWSTIYITPREDDVQNVESTSAILGGNRMEFTTRRKLDTGDDSEDFLITLGEELNMVWAMKKGDASWGYHDERGEWSINFDFSE